jgi:hypothetical protein
LFVWQYHQSSLVLLSLRQHRRLWENGGQHPAGLAMAFIGGGGDRIEYRKPAG